MNHFQLEKRIAELVEQITPLQRELDTHRQALLELQSEFKLGDIIQWRKRTGRVIGIMESASWLTWLVEIIRKDGSFGSHVKVRSYENPALISTERLNGIKAVHETRLVQSN